MAGEPQPAPYEPPKIERRDAVGRPLVGEIGSPLPGREGRSALRFASRPRSRRKGPGTLVCAGRGRHRRM